MLEQASFGRRRASAPSAQPGPRKASSPDPDLSPEAQAFSSRLARGGQSPADGFADWRRSSRGQLVLTLGLGLLVCSPSLIAILLQASPLVSAGLAVAGFLVNRWLRGQRRRRLREIVSWDGADD